MSTARTWLPLVQQTEYAFPPSILVAARRRTNRSPAANLVLKERRRFVNGESAQAKHVVLPLLLRDEPPLPAASALAAPEQPEGFASRPPLFDRPQDGFALLSHVDDGDVRQGYASALEVRHALSIFAQNSPDAGDSLRRPEIGGKNVESWSLSKTRFQLVALPIDPLPELGGFRVPTNESPKISEERISNSHTRFSRNTPGLESLPPRRGAY